MLKYLFCLLAIFSTDLIHAQNTRLVDSLEKLTTIQQDTELVKTYNELTWQYRNISRDKAIEYGNKALELGQKLHFDKGVAQAYNDMGIIYYDQDNHAKALELYNKAFEIRKKQGDFKGMAALYNKIGVLYQKEGSFALAELKGIFQTLPLDS